MATSGRKRKPPPHGGGGEAGGRAAKTASGPQPICCRVEGCLEPLAPGYHKKYRICLAHSSLDKMLIDGKTCRWCQQCGRFHGMEAFDGKFRSCRYSLARHQQRRQRRQAQLAAENQANEGQPLQQEQPLQQQGARTSPAADEQEAQLQLPLSAQGVWDVQPAAPKRIRHTIKPLPHRCAGGRQAGGHVKRPTPSAAETASAAGTNPQPAACRSLSPEQQVSQLLCSMPPVPSLPPAAQPARSMQQVQHWDAPQPVTPNQPDSHAGSSVPLADSPPTCTAHTAAVAHLQQAPWAPLRQEPVAPAQVAWGQQPEQAAPAVAAWGQQQPAAPLDAAGFWQVQDCGWLRAVGDQRLPPGQASRLPQQMMPSPATCGLQQPGAQSLRQPQQPQHMVIGTSNGSSGTTYYPCHEPSMLHELLRMHSRPGFRQLHSLAAEAAACSASTSAVAFTPHKPAQPYSLPPSGSWSSSGYSVAAPACGDSSGAPQHTLYYAADLPCMAGEPPVWASPSLPPPPAPAPAPAALPLDGSGSSSALSQQWGQLVRHDEQLVPVAAASPCAALQTSQPPGLLAGQGLFLQPTWLPGQLASQYPAAAPPRSPHALLSPGQLSNPRAAAPPSQPPLLHFSPLPSPCATLPPSPHTAASPSQPPMLHVGQLPTQSAAPPPSPRPAPPPSLQPSMQLSQMPSMQLSWLPPPSSAAAPPPPPQAPAGCREAQLCRQQQRCAADWADEALIASPLSCPPSPAVSWLAGF